jgi:hypothetical protein
MGAAATAAAALAVGAFVHFGVGKTGTGTALRLTARLAFLLFWPSYVGGALVTLLGPTFRLIKRRARELGLAFAAVLAVHLGLVGWLCWIGSAPPARIFVIFGVGVLWACLLALFSIERLGRLGGSMGWWILRNIGMNYIAFAFALDFLTPLHKGTAGHLAAYLPFAVLAVLGPPLRVIAALKLAAQGSIGKVTLNKVLNSIPKSPRLER